MTQEKHLIQHLIKKVLQSHSNYYRFATVAIFIIIKKESLTCRSHLAENDKYYLLIN